MVAKRSVTRKIVLAILFAVALVAGIGASLYLRLDASIDVHRAEIRALLEDVPVRHSTRLALATPEEPGNAWDLLRPAFDSLWALRAAPASADEISTAMEADFNAHGTPGPTPQLLERGRAALEACRQSRRRSTLDWTGPMDPQLPRKAARAGRALCSMGFMAWQEGRDAEAMEWFLTALSVAYDAARLGQNKTWQVLAVIESWVCEDARSVLAEQRLTAPELAEVERRLDRVRSQRPPLEQHFRTSGAQRRRDFLEDYSYQEDLQGRDPDFHSRLQPGWRDLYFEKVLIARILTGIRAGMEEAGAVPWSSGIDPFEACQRLHSRYRDDVVQRLSAEAEVAVFGPLRLEAFRSALACARFQAANGRMPLSFAETGFPPSFGTFPFTLQGNELVAPLGSTEAEWKIGRR